ncbi:hypothetical protein BU16DRAFT_538205 [Lophium mytilinum]|uniref:Aminoglycoside phosphotransferase domain-containing protein n=1 Tax=Lophium mytilinum TaxID=390894 RepID=A0A6A6R0Y4_9PEZI|nr:hypothetical protein BU16DRAFT_538205 [Lophium mytilinum]
MDLTTTPKMEEYLRSKHIPFTSLEPLTAGGSNYSWRIISSVGSVVKHATPYLKINTAVRLPIERQKFEAEAISVLPFHGDIQVPRLLFYDNQAHVLQISDAGSRNLIEAFSELDLQTVGARIGQWLAQLHSTPVNIDNQSVELSSMHLEQHLPGTLRASGHEALGEKILSFLFDGEENKSCQCHGDFLPSNIVVADEDTPTPTPQLTVIDWEWARRGNGAFDVGLFAGEVWMMEDFGRKGGLFDAFLAEYVKSRPLSLQDSLIVAARLGVHIIIWAKRGKWGPADVCYTVGVELLQKVLDRDLNWLGHSMVKVLFGGFRLEHTQDSI